MKTQKELAKTRELCDYCTQKYSEGLCYQFYCDIAYERYEVAEGDSDD